MARELRTPLARIRAALALAADGGPAVARVSLAEGTTTIALPAGAPPA